MRPPANPQSPGGARRAKMVFNGGAWKAICAVVYLVLLAIMLTVLHGGPLALYLQNDTAKIEDSVATTSLDGRQHPTYVLCNVQPISKKIAGMQGDPRTATYSDIFANYVGQNETWQPGSFVHKVWMTRALVGGTWVPVDIDLFKPVLVDLYRFGVCFALDLGPLVESSAGMPPEKGQEGHYEVFSTMLMVAMSADEPGTPEERQSVFAGFMVDKDEGLMLTGPAVMQDEAGIAFMNLKPGQGLIFRILQEYHENLRNCSSNNTKVSTCAEEAFSKKPGYCEGGGQDCLASQLEARGAMLAKMKTEGLEAIKSTTGCLLPCHRMHFTQYELVRDKYDLVFPEIFRYYPGAPNNTAVLGVIIPRLHKLKRIKEVINYPTSSFFGEVGGYLGLFLGLSIWGMFTLAVDAAEVARGLLAGRNNKDGIKVASARSGAWH